MIMIMIIMIMIIIITNYCTIILYTPARTPFTVHCKPRMSVKSDSLIMVMMDG
jgi:hypothetical protein